MFFVEIEKVEGAGLAHYDPRLELWALTVGGSSFLYH